ncbi:MAG: Kazal-type serine protease inhibitor domain-containing protein [Myxococcota bacterium]
MFHRTTSVTTLVTSLVALGGCSLDANDSERSVSVEGIELAQSREAIVSASAPTLKPSPSPGCFCGQIYDPVCGRDGETYPNGCTAFCNNTEVAFDGICGTGQPEEIASIDPATCAGLLSGLRPFPTEDGHFSAVQIPIAATSAFRVESFDFSLLGELGVPGCDDTIPGQIGLWVQDAAFPDASPNFLFQTHFTPTPVPGQPNSFFRIELPEPVVVGPGESLFVSFEMSFDSPDAKTCVLSCDNPNTPVGFWSNSATTPFPWSALTDFGLPGGPLIFVQGERLAPGLGSIR